MRITVPLAHEETKSAWTSQIGHSIVFGGIAVEVGKEVLLLSPKSLALPAFRVLSFLHFDAERT